MSNGITCYERDEVLCDDLMCQRIGCRIRHEQCSAVKSDPLAEAKAGMKVRLEARLKDGTEWVPVYPAQVEMFSANGAVIRAFEVDTPFNGVLELSSEEFDAFEKTMSEPQGPTESIKRGAALLDKLYGSKKDDPVMTERDQLRAVLFEARLQIDYLHKKFEPTGTGEATLARIDAVLSSSPISLACDSPRDPYLPSAHAALDKLNAPKPPVDTVELHSRILATIEEFAHGAFTGWKGKTGESTITLDEAEDHFGLCMSDLMDAVRAAASAQPPSRLDKGRAFYLALYENDGARWPANEHKGLWCDMAEDYERRLRYYGDYK